MKKLVLVGVVTLVASLFGATESCIVVDNGRTADGGVQPVAGKFSSAPADTGPCVVSAVAHGYSPIAPAEAVYFTWAESEACDLDVVRPGFLLFLK